MNKYIKVPVSPSKGDNEISSWEQKIKENYGPLSGYVSDLESGVSLNQILLNILKIENNSNYLNIRGIYLEHIKSLQNLDNENSTLKQEIQTLEGDTPSSKVADILIKYGILSEIELIIPYEKSSKYYEDIMGNDVFVQTKYQSLYAKYYQDLIVDANYVPDKNPAFKYSDLKLAVQVIVFSKAKFKAYDITNFLSNVSISCSRETGGNFSLKMHLVSIKDLESEENNFQDNNLNIKGYTKALLLQSIFRNNDLVFIRFERLKAEPYYYSYSLKKKQIKGRYWDMIGLIDTTTISSDYNSMNLSIVGRDLIKLLIDDSSFFIPYQFANSPQTMFGGKNTKIFKRLFTTGEYNLEFVKSFRSIENSLGFIFSQLTNVEVLSDACITFLQKEYENDLAKQFVYNEGGKQERSQIIRGIWGIINFVVDEKISHYRLADASLRSPNGSILQQIFKICQQPFVELIGDTFVDKYTLIARRPPFTIKDIYESKFIVIGREFSISDELQFSNEVYTVYELTPQGGCFTNNSSIALSYLPMVVLDEYTKLWGNKLYSQTYNYINIDAYNKMSKEGQKSIKETYIEDLIWLIETTAYLPFSRTGTITIVGDRRIKVGQWIYYEKTNEVFYVDGVSHTANIINGSVDRKTVINVSRGLVRNYIIPAKKRSKPNLNLTTADFHSGIKKEISVSNMSYADLVDIDLLREGLKEMTIQMNKQFDLHREVKEGDTFKSTTSLVINDVFNFFLSGAQFEGRINPYSLYYSKAALSMQEIDNIQNQNNYGGGYEQRMTYEDPGEPIPEDILNGGGGSGSTSSQSIPLSLPSSGGERRGSTTQTPLTLPNPEIRHIY